MRKQNSLTGVALFAAAFLTIIAVISNIFISPARSQTADLDNHIMTSPAFIVLGPLDAERREAVIYFAMGKYGVRFQDIPATADCLASFFKMHAQSSMNAALRSCQPKRAPLKGSLKN